MALKKLMGRPPKNIDECEDKDARRLHRFWRSTKLRCPCGCNNLFSYEEMWQGLARDGYSVWDCVDALKISHARVQGVIASLKLSLEFSGTFEREQWQVVARKAGYHNPIEMFFHLKTKKGFGYSTMAKNLGIPYEKEEEKQFFKEVVQAFIDPRRRDVNKALEEVYRRYPNGRVKQGWDKSKSVFKDIRKRVKDREKEKE